MLFSLAEILDVFITMIAAGFIFMDMFRRPGHEAEPFAKRLGFSILIAAPAIIFHELGHKFVATALGYVATFHAAYTWLGIGILLKLIGFPLLLIVPAYVSIAGPSGLGSAAVAFAGPAVNGLLWIISALLLRFGKFEKNTLAVLYFTRSINMFLFIFNLLPIPFFDGWAVWTNIF